MGKSTKSKKRSGGRKRKLADVENADTDGHMDAHTDDGEAYDPKPSRKRVRKSSTSKKKAKSVVKNEQIVDDDNVFAAVKMTRSQKRKLSKIMSETPDDQKEKEQPSTEIETNNEQLQQMQVHAQTNPQMHLGYANQANMQIDYGALNNMNFQSGMNQTTNDGSNGMYALNNMLLTHNNGMNNMNNMPTYHHAHSGIVPGSPTANRNTTIINNITNIHNINNQPFQQQFGGNNHQMQ